MPTIIEEAVAQKTDGETFAFTTTVIEPAHGWLSLPLDRVWQYRELLYFLVWRDVKVRYKQTVLGMLWIVTQPLVSMVIFTFLFGNLLDVPSGNVPYPLFAYAALLPWNYFATSLTRSSTSVVGNAHLVTKVYFPRLIIPISGVTSGIVDFFVSFSIFIFLLAIYGMTLSWRVIFLPGFLLLALFTALGFSLWLSALNVRYRDVQYIVPYLVQMWLYVTPVVYGSTLLPEEYRPLLALNPMTGVVEGFRWALLGEQLGDAWAPGFLFVVAVVTTLLVLVSGALFFCRTERTFADVV